MRFLLDTHTFIWWHSEPSKLSTKALELFQDDDSDLFLSVASLWEMQIKIQAGKLQLKMSLDAIVATQQQLSQIQILPIELPHVLGLEVLPPHHKDPFDRLLIAQARVENLTLISSDPIFKQYPVQVMW